MAHFAQINSSDNIVTTILVINDSKLLDGNGDVSEAVGIAYMESIWSESGKYWRQCSYNTKKGAHILGGTPFRKNFPQPGWTFNASADAFNPPRPTDMNGDPCTSWTITSSTGVWDAPIARSADDMMFATREYNEETGMWHITNGKDTLYFWDESVHQADNTEGWVAP